MSVDRIEVTESVIVVQVSEGLPIAISGWTPRISVVEAGAGYAFRVDYVGEGARPIGAVSGFLGPRGTVASANDATIIRLEQVIRNGVVDRAHLSQIVRDLLGKVPVFATSDEDSISLHQDNGETIDIPLDISRIQIVRKLQGVGKSARIVGGALVSKELVVDGAAVNEVTHTDTLPAHGQATAVTPLESQVDLSLASYSTDDTETQLAMGAVSGDHVAQGVTVASNAITFANAGDYRFHVSLDMTTAGGGAGVDRSKVDVLMKVGGTAIAYTRDSGYVRGASRTGIDGGQWYFKVDEELVLDAGDVVTFHIIPDFESAGQSLTIAASTLDIISGAVASILPPARSEDQIKDIAGALVSQSPLISYDAQTDAITTPDKAVTRRYVGDGAIDTDQLSAAVQRSLAASRAASELDVLTADPTEADHDVGDIANVNGTLRVLRADTDAGDTITGTLGHSGNYIGASNIPGTVMFGTINGNGLLMSWAVLPAGENQPLATCRIPFSGSPPASVFMEADIPHGDYFDELTRDSDHDVTESGITYYGYQAALTGNRATDTFVSGTTYSVKFWRDENRSSAYRLHENDRWENLIVAPPPQTPGRTGAQVNALADARINALVRAYGLAATSDSDAKDALIALLLTELLPRVEGASQDDAAALTAKSIRLGAALNAHPVLQYANVLGTPQLDDLVRTPEQSAAVTITTANQNQASFALSLSRSLGNTGSLASIEWQEQSGGNGGFWAGPVFRVVDGQEMFFRLFIGDGSHHDFTLRSRATDNDIRITRVGSSSWPAGEIRVFSL